MTIQIEFPKLKVAIVHYWFVGYTGGERVVESLAEIFPQADLFTLVANVDALPPSLRTRRLSTSFLQHIPGAVRWYRHFLAVQPLALEQFDFSKYDLILSSESGPAKGVISRPETCHICYCHSPMRYVWNMHTSYRRGLGRLAGGAFSLVAHYIRMWDSLAADRVDYFVANSYNTAARIRKYYRRDATVIYPPVNVSSVAVSNSVDDYYLLVGRLVEYKRADLAIQACNRLRRKLRVIGDGSDYKRLRRLAGPTVEFLGRVGEEELQKHYAHCRALLFPGEEDFGLVPVEAQAFGRPVIAYGRGGVLETVRPSRCLEASHAEGCTGVFFHEQTPESMVEAIRKFETMELYFSPSFIRSSVQRFDSVHFKIAMQQFINDSLSDHLMLNRLTDERSIFCEAAAHQIGN